MSCPLIANADGMRITRVDRSGNPVCGEDNGFVFDCFASLAMNINSDDGDDILATRYDKTPDSYLVGLHLRASIIWIKDLTRTTP